MAFTFQINTDVEFIHDENLLKKAEENKPVIQTRKVFPVCIAELIKDETQLNGITAKQSKKNLSQLPSYGWKRDDRLILDFGDHMVGKFEIDID